MTKKYTIGIDMGINNVGWSILNNDTNKIEEYGVRLFSESSDASERRATRNNRRRMKRKDTRLNDTIKLLRNIGFNNEVSCDNNMIEKRVKALNEQIDKQDIVNILCFFVSHRGYIPFGDEDVELIELNGKYPCEYFYEQYKKYGKYRASGKTVRNIDNINEIKKILNTQMKYYSEITDNFIDNYINIFSRKRSFWEGPGNQKSLTPYGRFKNKEDVINYNKEKEKNSSYEKYIFEDLVGNCKIEINEKCAPKLNFYAELFNLLNDFINVSFKSIDEVTNKDLFREEKNFYKLNEKGLNSIISYCINVDNCRLTYLKILSDVLGTNKDNIFGYRVNKNKNPEFSTLKYYRMVQQKVNECNFANDWVCDIDSYNELMRIMTVTPGSIELFKMIENNPIINYEFNDEEKLLLKELQAKFKKEGMLSYHSLSEKVLIRATNDMISLQKNFMQVRRLCDYDKKAREHFIKEYSSIESKQLKINPKFVDDIIASPQVKKSLRQAIRIINAIIKKEKCLPYTIAIESTKDLNSNDMKKEIEKRQSLEEKLRKNAISFLSNNYGDDSVNETNITKVMLYEETNHKCAYCGKQININELLSSNYHTEHILPRSKSFDNSYINKTVSCQTCNSKKDNMTPYQFLNPKGLYEEYKNNVLNNKNFSEAKVYNLLFEGDLDKYTTRFFNRNLRDTAYATTELINQINLFNNYLEYIKKDKINTLSTPGQLTSNLRKNNELIKDRDDGKYHHAVDASIVASITTTQIGKIMIDAQNNKQFWMKNKDGYVDREGLLYKVNIKDTIDQIKNINNDNTKYSYQVSKNPQKKLSNANILKLFVKDDKYYKIEQINNIYLLDVKKDGKLLDELFNTDSSSKTLLCYDNDINLFNLLKDIYQKYKNDKGNPFVNYCLDCNNIDVKEFDENIHGIKVSNKKNSPIVKKIRYYSSINEPYIINKKNMKSKDKTIIAFDSLAMYCTRVYEDIDKKEFVFLPVYSVSVNLKTKKINENDDYYLKFYNKYLNNKNVKHIVDLYNGNYIKIIKKSNESIEGEYQYFDKTNNKICLKNKSYFTKSDISLTVYDIDILGNKKIRLTHNIK